MSSGHSLLDHPFQLQHAPAHFHRQAPRLSKNFHVQSASSPIGSVMDPSQFGDFHFSYPLFPTNASVPELSEPAVPAYEDPPRADHYTLHHAVPTVPPSNLSNLHAINNSFSLKPEYNSTSIDGADKGSGADMSSPIANSPGDAVHDDYSVNMQDRADGTDLGGRTKEDNPDLAPAWSELKTKAGKDRKRLPLACIACRRKKIRCSGEKPACKHCLRSRIPCVYKVTSRKAAPRTDYMAMLDKRLKRMEERIIKIVPKPEQDSGPPVTRAVLKPTAPVANAGKAASKKRRAEDAFSPGFEVWANSVSIKSKADRESDTPKPLEHYENEDDKLFQEGLQALPSKDLQEHLAEVFFDQVYGQPYHLLHKPSYMRKLTNNALPPVLVLTVCAIAARFSTNPKLNNTPRPFLRGEEWASHAREICMKRYEWPNITILTCLVLLGLHEFGTCHGGRSWALGGQAIRMAYALQLHKDLDYDPQARGPRTKLSFIDREIRRRAMWSCYLMDRFTSSGIDRPMFIKEDSIRIPLPASERNFELDMPVATELLDGSLPTNAASSEYSTDENTQDNMGAAAYLLRAISIWGRIVTYLNHGGRKADRHPIWDESSQFAQHARDNDELLQTLPASLQYSRSNLEVHITEKTASHYLLLHAAIQQNTLYLYQAAASIVQADGIKDVQDDFIPKMASRTFAAASFISQLLRDADETQSFLWAPFGGYCAFSSTSVQLLAIVSGNTTLKATAEANCAVNVKFLRKLMRFWGMFHWMVEDIRRQYKTNYELARKGAGAKGTGLSAPLLQYADWFNRYPYGIQDADFMDPDLRRRREKGEDAVLGQKPEMQSVEEFFTTLSPAPQTKADGETPNPTATKRKGALARKQNTARTAQQRSEQNAVESKKKRVTEHVTTTQPLDNQLRLYSNSQVPQNPGAVSFPQPPARMQTSSYVTGAALDTDNIRQFSTQALDSSNVAYFGDASAIGMPRDGSIGQSMFPMSTANMVSSTPIMENSHDWQASIGHQQDQLNSMDMSNCFSGPNHTSSWFMPYDVEPPKMSQDVRMVGNNMATYDDIFGTISPNQNRN